MLTGEMTSTVMLTGVVGSTAMNERSGDQQARQVMPAHDVLLRNHTKIHSGVEVEFMGDGFMLTFPSAKRAVSTGIAMQKELMSPEIPLMYTRLAFRMGMTVGEPILEDQDLFGISVVRAARIGSMAGAGQILTSQIVYGLLSGAGQFKFDSAGNHSLKDVAEA